MDSLEMATMEELFEEMARRSIGLVVSWLQANEDGKSDNFYVQTFGGMTLCLGIAQRAAATLLKEATREPDIVSEDDDEEEGDDE